MSKNLVRVKLEDGSDVSVSESFAKSHKLTILNDKDAVDARGSALPAKHKTTVASAAAKKAASAAPSGDSSS